MGKKLKNFGIYCLMLGVSTSALVYNVAKQQVPDLSKGRVTVNNKSMMIYDFYDNLTFESGAWFYVDEKGNKTNLRSLYDRRYRAKEHDSISGMMDNKKVADTIYIEWVDKNKKQKHIDQLDSKAIEENVLRAKMIKFFKLDRQ